VRCVTKMFCFAETGVTVRELQIDASAGIRRHQALAQATVSEGEGRFRLHTEPPGSHPRFARISA